MGASRGRKWHARAWAASLCAVGVGTHRWLGRSWWVWASVWGVSGWMDAWRRTHSCVHSLLTSRSVIELFPVAASISLGVPPMNAMGSPARAQNVPHPPSPHTVIVILLSGSISSHFPKERQKRERKQKKEKIVSRRRDERVWCWSIGRSIGRVCRRSPSRQSGRNNSTGSLSAQ